MVNVMNAETKHLYKLKADVIAAAGHPIRLAVIDFLKDGEQCVCDIAEYVGAERSNVSRHLSVMLNSGLLDCRKDGLKVIYRLKCACIVDFFECVTGVLREQAEENQKLLTALK